MDRFVLLDAQDWMNNRQLDELWSRITRASRPGARVLFRTAAEPSLLPGRLDDAILGRWRYLEEVSADLTRRDRSSIYGGVHVYELA
jgi:S-adenosylmethionine-diacylglycerol 3-amino-3-carboxypropyl transferase